MTGVFAFSLIFIAANIKFIESAWGTQQTCLVSSWSSWTWFGNGTGTRNREILRYPSAGQPRCPQLVETMQKEICNVSQWTGWYQSSYSQQLERTRSITFRTTPIAPCPSLKETLKTGSVLSETTEQTGERFATSFFVGQGKLRTKRQAEGQVRDLLIIIDSSASVPGSAYTTMKKELGKLLALLCPVPDPFDRSLSAYQQVALLTFSSQVREVFDFDANSNVCDVRTNINTAPYLGGSTCTGDAFEYGKSMFSSSKGARVGQSNVKREVLIITDGMSNCGRNARNAAYSLQKDKDATVFALMVGNKTPGGMAEVADYVSDPKLDHLFLIKGTADFTVFARAARDRVIKDCLICAPFE